MKTSTKNALLGASVVAFAGLCAVGGYFFAKKTEKNSTDDTKDYIATASDSDLYEEEEDYDYEDYDYSKMIDYITVGDYKGIKINKIVPTIDDIDDDTIQGDMEYYLEEYKEYKEIKDRGIQEGDYVNLSYTVTIDDAEIDDFSTSDYELHIGEGEPFKDFENAIIGILPYTTTDVELTIPSDYFYDDEEGKDYIGKNAIFTITVNSINECTYDPELSDEFVKQKIDGCNTIDEWQKLLKQEELDYLIDESEEQIKNDIYDAIINIAEFTDYDGLIDTYPGLYDDKIMEISEEYESYASMFGMTLEEYMEFSGMEEDALEKIANDAIKGDIAFAYIIAKENLTVSEERINAFAESEYEAYDYDSVDDFWNDFTKEEVEEYLINDVCYEFLIENADVTEMSQSEYDKLMGYDYEDENTDSDDTDLDIDEDDVDTDNGDDLGIEDIDAQDFLEIMEDLDE